MTYTSPAPVSDSKQRGKFRASLRTGTITLTGKTTGKSGAGARKGECAISDFASINFIVQAGGILSILAQLARYRRMIQIDDDSH
jgi:hypothetical protein